MSRWFRFYDDVINDPKILSLPEAMRWTWVAVLCASSKTDGNLPATDHLGLMLRVTKQRAAAIITTLHSAGLLDKTETGFAPHNWSGRQYKSDVSNERVQRYRQRKRNVTVTSPETETETEKISEARASGADAPNHRKRLFSEGLATLAKITGKGPDACRAFVGKCLSAASDDAVTVLGLIEDAERNQVVDPAAWIVARLKPSTGPPSGGKPLTEFQRKQQATNDVTQKLRDAAVAARGGGEADRLLSHDHGERPGDLRGGPGAPVLALSRASGSGSG